MSTPEFPKIPSRPPVYRPRKKTPLGWVTTCSSLMLQITTLVFVALLFLKVQYPSSPAITPSSSSPSPSPVNTPQATSSLVSSPTPLPSDTPTPTPALEWLSESLNLAFAEPIDISFRATGVAPEHLNFTLQPGNIAVSPDQIEYSEGGMGTIHLPPASYVGDFQIQSSIVSAPPFSVHIEPPDIQSALTISPDIRMGEERIIIPGVTEITVNLDGNWQWGMLPDGWEIPTDTQRTILVPPSFTSTDPSLTLTLMFPDVFASGEQPGWESPPVPLPVVPVTPLPEDAKGQLYQYDIIGRADFPTQDTEMDRILYDVQKCSSAMWILGDPDASDEYYRVMALGWVKPLELDAFNTSGDIGIVLDQNAGDEIKDIISLQAWYPNDKKDSSCSVNKGLSGAKGLIVRLPTGKDDMTGKDDKTGKDDMMQLIVFGLVPKK